MKSSGVGVLLMLSYLYLFNFLWNILTVNQHVDEKIFSYRPKADVETDEKRVVKAASADENRELKVSSNLQLTSGNSNEVSIKESSFHHGVAVPMTLEDYEKEIAREKDLVTKAKKKMESSTLKDGISTWILLSGSNNPTARPEMKPAFRIDSEEKKPTKNNNATMTTKKRNPTTTTIKTPKPTQKYNNNKLITRIKATALANARNETEEEKTTKAPATTKKVQLTTKAKKYTTVRPKTTTITTTPTSTKSTEAVEIIDDDDEEVEEQQTSAPSVETSTYLIMEPKDADFNLPNDRAPSKTTVKKTEVKAGTSVKTKKKKIGVASTNSTRIKKKSDKKTSSTKLSSKNPEKPFSTQIYNYLAREVMPTVGVGLVGLVVTAGLATYFLGGPLTALRRSYDISNRRDDVAYDRSDEFGNIQNEEEMFGKVIAGMPENSAYRNNLRVSSYRPKVQPYSGYSQYSQQAPKYAAQQQLRYRTIDPYQNSYQSAQNTAQQYPQYYQQAQIQAQTQAKSSVIDYGNQQQIQAQQPAQTQQQISPQFNIDSVDMTTNQPEPAPQLSQHSSDYDDIAQSYFPQQVESQSPQFSVEHQRMQEIEDKSQNEIPRSEKITIVQAQSVPANHRNEGNSNEQPLPTPEALTMSHSDEEYQNSIANAIMSQKKQQFVVGSVVAENFEESQPSAVPEHGPRRRRQAVRKIAKSLEDNEIDEDEDKTKRDTEATTIKAEQSSKKEDHEPGSTTAEITGSHEESSTQYPTYNIENIQNNIFHLFRRIIDLKLRLGLNFLQNATRAFQHYLNGVEQRVNTSTLFNLYMQNVTTNDTTEKIVNAEVEAL